MTAEASTAAAVAATHKAAEMQSLSAACVNSILQQEGFILKKGDARRVAEAIMSGSSPSSQKVVEVANALGIEKSGRVLGRVGASAALAPSSCRPPDFDMAVRWIAEDVACRLERTGVDDLAASILKGAAEGRKARVRTDHTPWDYSTRGETTGLPFDLASYASIGDFLEEATGGTRATFTSGMGFLAETWESLAEEMARNLVTDVFATAVQEALSTAPIEVASCIEEMGGVGSFSQAAWDDDVGEVLGELGYSELALLSKVAELPFRETLIRLLPDEADRLARDVEAAQVRERRRLDAQKRSHALHTSLMGRFDGQKLAADEAYRLLNAAVEGATTREGLEEVRPATTGPWLDKLLTGGAQRKFREMLRDWLEAMEDRSEVLDFENPLVTLFATLAAAKRGDGRHWYVTVAQGPRSYTFAEDNWAWFLHYALTSGLDLANNRYSVLLRRFERLRDPDADLPIKSVGAMVIHGQEVHFLKAKEVAEASLVDAATGRRLQREPAVRFLDCVALVPSFAATLEKLSRAPH